MLNTLVCFQERQSRHQHWTNGAVTADHLSLAHPAICSSVLRQTIRTITEDLKCVSYHVMSVSYPISGFLLFVCLFVLSSYSLKLNCQLSFTEISEDFGLLFRFFFYKHLKSRASHLVTMLSKYFTLFLSAVFTLRSIKENCRTIYRKSAKDLNRNIVAEVK